MSGVRISNKYNSGFQGNHDHQTLARSRPPPQGRAGRHVQAKRVCCGHLAGACGTAEPEYQDAEKFFARTFITEGMRLLLQSVAERLCGRGGDPVIQLQTAFGGGKTHTLLAVYHLAGASAPPKS
jgi:hypothetical protein